MVGLVDIVPQRRTVQLAGGQSITLQGLGLRQIAGLFLAYPMLRDLFVDGTGEVSLAEVILQVPEAAAVIIAEAACEPDSAEKIGTELLPDDVLDCLDAIGELTFPRGLGPLVQRVTKLLASGLVTLQLARGADTSSPPAPNGSLAPDTLSATSSQ